MVCMYTMNLKILKLMVYTHTMLHVYRYIKLAGHGKGVYISLKKVMKEAKRLSVCQWTR